MKHQRSKTSQVEAAVQIAFDRRVLECIRAELTKSPDVEEGGKYVGYMLREGSSQLRVVGLDRDRAALVVTDFLPSGPNAVRTAVELQPDGEYQERLFRQLEQMDPEVEHLGTWHSHHCNGLQTLSRGDIDGYRRTVNKRAYRPDHFLASLVTRLPRSADDVGWIDHFLFVRGKQEYYRITDSIRIIDCPTRFAGLIDHLSQSAAPNKRTPDETSSVTPSEQDEGPWYESPEGRRILAEDKRSLAPRFRDGLVATRRGRIITMTGRLDQTSVCVTYPSNSGDSQIAVTVNHDKTKILQIDADLHWRELVFSAAMFAAENLRPDPVANPQC